MKNLILAAALSTAALLPAQAAILITEVSPSSSGNTTYMADWFELTNTGSTAVDITGWRVDDSSNSLAASLALRGVTSLAPGRSVVFIEGTTAGTTDATLTASFTSAWFNTNVPATFVIGTYGGAGIGLGTGGDAVNIYDAGGVAVANIVFGASTAGVTFDNGAGLNNTTISTLSQAGVRGAFTSAVGNEVGSPGAVPEPGTGALLGVGALVGAYGIRRRLAGNRAA